MTPHIDPEQMKADALVIKDALLDRAAEALDRAGDLAEHGIEWAQPHVQQVQERATPAVQSAAERAAAIAQEAAERAKPAAERAAVIAQEAAVRAKPAVEQAAQTVQAAAQEAADRAKPAISEAQHRLTDDYLPRVNRAVHDAQAAANIDGDLAERARAVRAASAAALAKPAVTVPKRRGAKVGKALGLTALGAGVAGVGWLLWKRSQPIEDPWAEEYWADLEAKSDDTWGEIPVEKADGMTPSDIAEGAAAVVAGGESGTQPDGKKLDEVSQIVEDVKAKAAGAAADAKEAVKDAVDDGDPSATDLGEAAAEADEKLDEFVADDAEAAEEAAKQDDVEEKAPATKAPRKKGGTAKK